jgi:hypothetical protein
MGIKKRSYCYNSGLARGFTFNKHIELYELRASIVLCSCAYKFNAFPYVPTTFCFVDMLMVFVFSGKYVSTLNIHSQDEGIFLPQGLL